MEPPQGNMAGLAVRCVSRGLASAPQGRATHRPRVRMQADRHAGRRGCGGSSSTAHATAVHDGSPHRTGHRAQAATHTPSHTRHRVMAQHAAAAHQHRSGPPCHSSAGRACMACPASSSAWAVRRHRTSPHPPPHLTSLQPRPAQVNTAPTSLLCPQALHAAPHLLAHTLARAHNTRTR
jgi:hypothetical protein